MQELTSNYFTEVCFRKKLQVEIYQAGNSHCFYFKLNYVITKESVIIILSGLL